MPDYIYLLENRLSAAQQSALRAVRELTRAAQMPVFLIGDAVRDLTSGNSVRELEVVVHGNVCELKKSILAAGGVLWGENTAARRLYLRFPGSVRLDLTSARKTDYPKCGKPVYTWASIHEDLRSRDFTVNAMAISLNDGSYGLLMDPTNGAADIETRHLRLVSNYGFLEEPARLIRAARLRVRLGFELEERTARRYENARAEEIIGQLSDEERSRELEQIGHEEEPLKVMDAYESDGWMKALFAGWTSAKADAEKLRALHELSIELQVQGVYPDVSAAQMQLLTAKVSAKDLAELKKAMLRPGFVAEWNGLDQSAAEFSKVLLAKENARPSAGYTLFTSYAPEAVLWLGFTSKQAAVQEKYRSFLKEWPLSRQRIPHSLMLEMRITPELAGYAELVQKMFLELLDGGLTMVEEMRAFLEPFSPPAPPPPVTIKRSRAKKSTEARVKVRVDDDDEDELEGEDAEDVDGLEIDGDDMDFALGDGEDRTLLTETEGDDDDVFARATVSDDVEMAEDDGDESEIVESEEDPEPPRGGKAGKSAGTSRSAAKAVGKQAPGRSGGVNASSPKAGKSASRVTESRPSAKVEAKPTSKAGPLKTPPEKTPLGKAVAKTPAKAAAKTPVAASRDGKSTSQSAKAPVKAAARKEAALRPAKKVAAPAGRVTGKAGTAGKAAVKPVARPSAAPSKSTSKAARTPQRPVPALKKASKVATKAISKGSGSSGKSSAAKKGKKR